MKINFTKQVLPHLIAIVIFLIVTVAFFNPFFFGNKSLEQHDIAQWQGGAQELKEYREATGEEGLWANSMFSGMPAYLVNIDWSDGIISGMKKVMSLALPHPVANIFIAFLSFYILLLVFRVRPYLAIGGALAFGLSSFMIIGLGAGHNSRIGAIAFMPLVLAGIHLTFTKNSILGFGMTAAALALELRENHLQITYYLLLMVIVYGIIMLIDAFKKGDTVIFLKNTGLLVLAAIIAVSTFFAKFWAISEYSQYSIRGQSELAAANDNEDQSSGLKKDYAFQYSNGILEPLTLIIPDFYGGASSHYLIQDEDSKVLQALKGTGDPQAANQLARYTSAYWGDQPLSAPYYAGAVICFLFVIGLLFADKKYVVWLSIVTGLAIVLSWGNNFEAFNYFMFDYFPGYNKFRSVTFTLAMALLAMPLLGFIGLEKLLDKGFNRETQKKLLLALGITGGFCLLVVLFAGMASFTKTGELQLPGWFLDALRDDRESLIRGDAFRSLIFIIIAFGLVFFHLRKKLSFGLMAGLLSLFILIDLWAVDRRYFGEDSYKRSGKKEAPFTMTEADKEIKKDQALSYRVYNLQNAFSEARTSYFHQSIGGYHGAKLRRYQDLYEHCLEPETRELIQKLQSGTRGMNEFGIINMLNTKYLTFGPSKRDFLKNPAALGNAWFVASVEKVKTPDDELKKTCNINTANTAVVDVSKFEPGKISYDNNASVRLTDYKPNQLTYEAQTNVNGLAVFSEIYYPKGWTAAIDGKEVEIIRANYVLRALEVPAGKHTITFTFKPRAYEVGDPVSFASSILLLLVFVGCIGWTIKKEM